MHADDLPHVHAHDLLIEKGTQAMKKLTKTTKLALSSQTVRQLSNQNLAEVAGGIPQTFFGCTSSCITMLCR